LVCIIPNSLSKWIKHIIFHQESIASWSSSNTPYHPINFIICFPSQVGGGVVANIFDSIDHEADVGTGLNKPSSGKSAMMAIEIVVLAIALPTLVFWLLLHLLPMEWMGLQSVG
jgi:hypothetical protein